MVESRKVPQSLVCLRFTAAYIKQSRLGMRLRLGQGRGQKGVQFQVNRFGYADGFHSSFLRRLGLKDLHFPSWTAKNCTIDQSPAYCSLGLDVATTALLPARGITRNQLTYQNTLLACRSQPLGPQESVAIECCTF